VSDRLFKEIVVVLLSGLFADMLNRNGVPWWVLCLPLFINLAFWLLDRNWRNGVSKGKK
jgi:hypothetical protein